jgi:hypothetical protein
VRSWEDGSETEEVGGRGRRGKGTREERWVKKGEVTRDAMSKVSWKSKVRWEASSKLQ